MIFLWHMVIFQFANKLPADDRSMENPMGSVSDFFQSSHCWGHIFGDLSLHVRLHQASWLTFLDVRIVRFLALAGLDCVHFLDSQSERWPKKLKSTRGIRLTVGCCWLYPMYPQIQKFTLLENLRFLWQPKILSLIGIRWVYHYLLISVKFFPFLPSKNSTLR